MLLAIRGNFLPRAGIAIRINDKTSFRAGYARFATPILTLHPESGGLPTNGFSQSTSILGPLNGTPRAHIDDPFPASNPVVLPAGNNLGSYTDLGNSINWWKQGFSSPMNDRLGFTLQRQAPAHFLLEGTFFMMFMHNVQGNSMGGGST